MCTRYRPPGYSPERHVDLRQLFKQLVPGAGRPIEAWSRDAAGPIIRRDGGAAEDSAELMGALWRMMPLPPEGSKAKTWPTYNARSETVAEKRTFAPSWKHGQRCLVLADWWLEPCWETGKNVWWQFSRADGEVCALAGIWREWTEAATGEIVTGMTMLTVNADTHPLMSRMHRPDPKRPVELQDKRSVVLIEPADQARWLYGTEADARSMLVAPAVDVLQATPIGA